MSSRPDRLSAAGPPRRAVFIVVAWIIMGIGALGPGARGHAESRFLPWSDPPIPALSLRDLAGEPRALADLRGHVVLVNFWATWCEFCRDEVASMATLQAQLAGRPLTILLVNFGQSPAAVRAYARQLPGNVHVLLDPGQETARRWRVHVIPSTFVIDAEGRARFRVIGNLDWASEEAPRTVRALLP